MNSKVAGEIHRPRRFALACLLMIALISPSTARPVTKQGPVTAVTVGFFLGKLMDQLQQAIEAARNAGLSLEIEAGREVNIALANAQNAYADSLNKTIDNINQTMKGTLDQLQSMVNDVTNNTFGSLDAITARAQQIVNSLPFRPHEPQLTRTGPRFVVPSQQTYPVTLRFQGNFEFAAKKNYTPSFQVNGHTYVPSSNTTQELQFIVPVSELFAAPPDTGKYSYVMGTLIVPWRRLLVKREEDHYRLILGALPARIGKIRLIHTTSHVDHPTKHFESSQFYQSSGSDGANDDHKDVPYDVIPDTGWHVVRNTSSFNDKGSEGDWGRTFVSDGGDHVTYRVTTIHHSIGTAGRVHFTISFNETQDVTVSDQNSEDVTLNWGDSRSFSYPAGTWKVVFDAFDGTHAEFSGADLSNPFLKLRDQAGSLVISTADPKTLVWP
jgi:hypothetical protein